MSSKLTKPAELMTCLSSDLLRAIALFAVRSLRGLCVLRLVNRRLHAALNHPVVMSKLLAYVRSPLLLFRLHQLPVGGLRRLQLHTTKGLKPGQLPTLKSLTSLSVSGCHALAAVESLHLPPTLTALDLSFCTNLKCLAGVELLVHLHSLDLSFVHGFGPLPALPTSLRELSLSFSNVTDLTVVSGLSELTHLNLSGCSELLDSALLCVSSLSKLAHLNLTGCVGLRDLAPLSSVQSLQVLNLTNCHVQDLRPVSKLPHLTRLELTNCEGVRSLDGVPPRLHTLNLNLSAACADVQGLSKLIGLRVLHLAGSHVQDLRALEHMPQLESLYVWTCEKLQDSCLQSLKNLTGLRLFDVYQCDGITALGLKSLGIGLKKLKITVRFS
jgi:hypothetical protein